MIPKTCFFTGHRVLKPSDKPDIKDRIRKEVINAINNDVKVFIAGGAVGFDMLASEVVLSLKEEYDISLCLYLPCIDHTMLWNEGDKVRFDNIFAMADEHYYVTDKKYSDGCMQKRNFAMAEASDMCIAYMKSEHSGTAQAVKMAEKKGIKVINIA